jgi:hypothetical protein
VTNAKAFQSYHQFGLAADCAFLRDGKLVISEKDPWAMRGYQFYGRRRSGRPALGRPLDNDGLRPHRIACGRCRQALNAIVLRKNSRLC